MHGETLPLDACSNPDGAGRLGVSLPVPAGVVVAISPFNYPILLAAHKVGPALAGGNAVVMKPASATPLSGIELARLLIDAAFPDNAVQVLTGPGRDVAGRLCADDRVRVISFTGSRAVGLQITRTAGIKRLSLELGSTSPLVILSNADIDAAAGTIASTAYFNAGQVCGSIQRVLVDKAVKRDLIDALVPLVEEVRAGDPKDPSSTIGPLVSATEAERVESLVNEAVAAGAEIIVGGGRDGAVYEPTVVTDTSPYSAFFREEVFGPAVGLTEFDGLEQAMRLANVGDYGLTAGIFTKDLDEAMEVARRAAFGSVQINASPMWRTDGMPFGGIKQSGIGKEGPRYAVQEMLEHKTVVFHPSSL
jgi:glyceraldehyde-3-phosphate dehydrogenase (NADP+)